MKTQTFKVDKTIMLTAFIKANIFGAGYAFCKTVLKNKDAKINGERVSSDMALNKGDVVQIYYADDAIKNYNPYTVIYEDDNVLIVFKEQGIEVTSSNKNTLETRINQDRRVTNIAAAHRLDINTEGLVIFSKTEEAAEHLRIGFESNYIDKFYLALCFGTLKLTPLTLTGFLKKDSESGIVEIVKEKVPGALPVKTILSFVKSVGDFSLLNIKAVTGRTHQIRAHLASIKLYIVGDGKYGNTKLNNVYGYNKQCLCAHQLGFNFPAASHLSYLNSKKFEVTPTFLKK